MNNPHPSALSSGMATSVAMSDTKWASGRIHCRTGIGVVAGWIVAILLIAICIPVTIRGWQEYQAGRIPGPAFALAMLFPLVALGVLGGVVLFTVRRMKFGASTLELETLPGAVGGWFAGTLRTTARLDEAEEVQLTLRCIERSTSGHGKNKRKRERSLWESGQTLIGRPPADADGGGSALPVAFRVPPTCRPTGRSGSDEILWRVLARAPMPGADYVVRFEVPVYAVRQQGNFLPAAERAARPLRLPRPVEARQSEDPNVRFSTDAAGRKHFDFPAGRLPFGAAMAFTMALAFGGIAWFLVVRQDKTALALPFVAFALFCAWWALVLWFQARHVVVDRHGVEVSTHLLGTHRSKRLEAKEVASVKYERKAGFGGTPYFSVFVRANDGRSVTAASWLRADDAEWVASEIAQALGVRAELQGSDRPA